MEQAPEYHLRDHAISELTERLTFMQAVYYTWTGHLPDGKEEAMLNACFVAVLDHGKETPSAKAVLNEDLSLNQAMAKAVLAQDKFHGMGALAKATELYEATIKENKSARQLVSEYLSQEKRLPGFGHRLYKESDPRTKVLLQKAVDLGFDSEYLQLVRKIEHELEKQKGKKLPLNVDGAIAAIALMLGIPAKAAPGIFAASRMIGLISHKANLL